MRKLLRKLYLQGKIDWNKWFGISTRISTRVPIPQNYSFSSSIALLDTNVLEYCLHISYRLDIKTYQIKGMTKTAVQNKEEEIIDKFR